MLMLISVVCSIHILLEQCAGVTFIDVYPINEPVKKGKPGWETQESEPMNIFPPIRSTHNNKNRRHMSLMQFRSIGQDDEKDSNLKIKIATLVQQTLHDTERKIRSIQHVKEKYRETGPYKAGFILSMVKKSRDVLNELFNVAVKHRDDWKALEQMKIFELIVHTNVDTTNLVRQLVEIHIQHLNSTNTSRRRVVLLK